MSLPRLTIETAEPAFFLFRMDLVLCTCIDERAFKAWADYHSLTLVDEFRREGLPGEYFRGWAMEKFANREQVSA